MRLEFGRSPRAQQIRLSSGGRLLEYFWGAAREASSTGLRRRRPGA